MQISSLQSLHITNTWTASFMRCRRHSFINTQAYVEWWQRNIIYQQMSMNMHGISSPSSWLGLVHNITLSQKTSHLWFAITLTHMNTFWYFFGRNVTDKVSNQKMLYCATSNNVCFCTTWQTEKHENRIFHSTAVSVHCQNSTSCSLISSIFLTRDSYSWCCTTL